MSLIPIKKKPIVLIVIVLLCILIVFVTPTLSEFFAEKIVHVKQTSLFKDAIALQENKLYKDAIEQFKLVKETHPAAQDHIYECSYKIAWTAARRGDFEEAEQYLIPEEVALANPSKYSGYHSLVTDIQKWKILKEFDGTYQDVESKERYVVIVDGIRHIFTGGTAYITKEAVKYSQQPYSIGKHTLKYTDGAVGFSTLFYDATLSFVDGFLVEYATVHEDSIDLYKDYELTSGNKFQLWYQKISNTTQIPQEKPIASSNHTKREPQIGMTAAEVEKSSWGKPHDINRTTTAYGVHEQWCYYNHRYIYLDNGIVTAIQE